MQEDIFLLIESYRLEFTGVEQVVADYFLSKKESLTISNLSTKISVSKASITRFCKKIGLNNYKELIFLYNLSLSREKETGATTESSAITSVYHSLATRTDGTYVAESVEKFCQLLHHHKIIHFLGTGFNAYAGMDFQFKFSRFGKYVRVISEENSILMSTEFADPSELVIACSLRGTDEAMLRALKNAKKKQIPIVVITANKDSHLVKYADVVLFAASLTREESMGNISPQIPILIQLDIVYERYIHSYSDYLQNWLQSEAILTNRGREEDY